MNLLWSMMYGGRVMVAVSCLTLTVGFGGIFGRWRACIPRLLKPAPKTLPRRGSGIPGVCRFQAFANSDCSVIARLFLFTESDWIL